MSLMQWGGPMLCPKESWAMRDKLEFFALVDARKDAILTEKDAEGILSEKRCRGSH